MKKIIKISLIYLSVFLFAFLFKIDVHALTKTTDDAGRYNYTTVNEDRVQLSDSVEYIKNTGFTTRTNKQYDQVNHILCADMTSNEDVKVVTWAIKNQTNTGFTRNDLLEIAKDYEKNHPGWIVLGGVNSDQYYTKYGTGAGTNGSYIYYPQPYYPMMSEGENWFTISPYASCNNVIGFKNDNSLNQIVYGHRTVAGFKINIFDDNNNKIKSFDVTDLNMFGALKDGETTIISPFKSNEEDVYQTVYKTSRNNLLYVVENADLSYVSNSKIFETSVQGGNVNAFFGKGRISKITDDVELSMNQFAIETTNQELKDALSVGTYVKCEYEFDSGFDGIREASGFHTVQRLNGADQNVDNSYNTRAYPRSIMGCDSTSGKVYLITCEGKNSAPTAGMYAQESNALMKQYNITDAFQMDGGGSVTSVIRNENGELQFSMPSVESSYRLIACGLFMVMKVPTVEVKVNDISDNKVVIDLDDSKENEKYSKMFLKVDINGVSKFFEADSNNQVTIEGLESQTQYNYILCLQKDGEELFETKIQGSFKTRKHSPNVVSLNYYLDDENLILKVNCTDPDKTIIKVSVVIGGKSYFVILEDNIGTINLGEDARNFLDVKVKIECITLEEIEEIVFENISLEANAYVYPMHIVSAMESFMDEILK